MNTENTDILTQNINQLIEWTKQSAETVGNFASEQVPLYVQELLNWIFWGNIITASSVLLIFGVIAILFRKIIKYIFSSEALQDSEGGIIFVWIFGPFIIFLVSLFWVFWPIREAVKVTVAPRVVLVEKLSEMVKK